MILWRSYIDYRSLSFEVTDNPRLQSHTAVTLAHIQASAVSWGPTPGLRWAANASHVRVGRSSADLSRPPPGSSAGLLLCLLTSHWPKQVTWLSPVLKGWGRSGKGLKFTRGKGYEEPRPLLQSSTVTTLRKSSRAATSSATITSLSL